MRSRGPIDPQHAAKRTTFDFGFVLVLSYLVLEYGRPQDIVSALGELRLTLVIALLMVVAWFASGGLRRAASPQIFHMVLMLFLLAIHIPFATNNYWAYQTTLGYLLLLPLSVSIVLFVSNFERLRILMKCWIALSIYLAMRGIYNRGVAGSSFLYDENDTALLMNVMLPFAICLFMYERKTVARMVYLGAALLCVVTVVVSSSRGGLLGLIAVLGIIWLASPKKVLALALAGVLALGVLVAADQKYWDRMSTIDNTEGGTGKIRIESWKAGWNMFVDNPQGVGPGNFPVKFPEYQSEGFTKGMWGRQAHSLWFTLLPELGIPGVLLYFSLLRLNLRDIRYLRRAPPDNDDLQFARALSLAFMASLAGFFVSGTFLSVLYYPHYWYVTAMIIATKKIVDSAVASTSPPMSKPVSMVAASRARETSARG